MCVVIICLPVDDVINFEINLSYQAVFLHDQNSKDKNLNTLRTKRALNMKQEPLALWSAQLYVLRHLLV